MNQDDSSARMLSVESGADINPLSSDVPPLLGLVLRSLSSHKAHSSEGSLNLSSPLTESGFRNISPTVPELMKRYWSDPYLVAELVACICFGVLGHFAPDMIFQMSLHEREIPYQITANGDVILDQYINRPLVDHDTIPDWLLVVLAFILPLVVVIAVGTIGKTKHDVHSGVCALFFIVGSTEFITNFVKIYAGYFRPNFYEYCEFSADDMACASDRLDPRKSFPSGHASGSFCGMTMLTQYFFGKIGLHRRVVDELSDNTHVSLMQKRFFSIVAGSPMFLAVFISSSRVHDDMHHPADIVGGALIGICCAIFGYGLWSLAKHQQARQLSVKEIAWCKPGTQDSNREKEELKVKLSGPEECTSCNNQDSNNSFKFGIIAAMDESRIIGVDRGLPWSLPEDRAHFFSVTRDRVLIIGKNCFFEESDFSHLEHLRHCVVVSTTLNQQKLEDMNLKNVQIARSFEEALVLGEKVSRDASEEKDGELEIDCWIGGGQLIYEKAIRHRNAYQLILTKIHTKLNIDFSSGREIALFPAKYRWDNAFNEVSKREGADKESGLTYTFFYYRRR